MLQDRRKHKLKVNDYHLHYIRSVFYLNTVELIKYNVAIKVFSNAVTNIYKIRNLSIL